VLRRDEVGQVVGAKSDQLQAGGHAVARCTWLAKVWLRAPGTA
jgi:hypothetical protein